MSMEETIPLLSGIAGLIIGFLIRHFLIRDASKRDLQDELTKIKREMANQKGIITDFIQNSGTLFDQLEASYSNYAKFMNEQSKKIIPQFDNMYESSKHEVYKFNREENDLNNDKNSPSGKKNVIMEAEIISESTESSEEKSNTSK